MTLVVILDALGFFLLSYTGEIGAHELHALGGHAPFVLGRVRCKEGARRDIRLPYGDLAQGIADDCLAHELGVFDVVVDVQVVVCEGGRPGLGIHDCGEEGVGGW